MSEEKKTEENVPVLNGNPAAAPLAEAPAPTPQADPGPAPEQAGPAVAAAESAAPTPPVESKAAAEPAPKKLSLLAKIFNKETRFGRFNRALVRTLGIIVGLFALGLLAGYILLYQPTERQLASTQVDLDSAHIQIGNLESTAEDSQAKYDELNRSYATAQSLLDGVTARMHLARMSSAVLQARLALADRDGPTAQKALKAAQQEMDALKGSAGKADPETANDIQTRLTLASSELTRDPKTADADLQILSDALNTLDGKLAE